MTPLIKGLVLAALQVGLVASLGAKLLYDRATRPRVWTLAAPYDPTCRSAVATSAYNLS